VNLAQRLLLTHRGRIALVAVYVLAALVSIVVYSIVRSPGYGLGQLVVLGLGFAFIVWCVRRA
jgi:multisubunit Na+/H+ antiporter MnhB subunit